jgi:hypothetical protein
MGHDKHCVRASIFKDISIDLIQRIHLSKSVTASLTTRSIEKNCMFNIRKSEWRRDVRAILEESMTKTSARLHLSGFLYDDRTERYFFARRSASKRGSHEHGITFPESEKFKNQLEAMENVSCCD